MNHHIVKSQIKLVDVDNRSTMKKILSKVSSELKRVCLTDVFIWTIAIVGVIVYSAIVPHI